MIPNQWYAICESDEIVARKPHALKRMGMELVAWRDAEKRVHVMEDRCPHRGAMLSLGTVGDDHIACPYHGFEFPADGMCRYMPCSGRKAVIPKTMRVEAFEAREAHGFLWMWWGEKRDAYPDIPWFDDLPTNVDNAATRAEVWPINYVRAIESNFDVHHFPFVHKSINRGALKMGPRLDPLDVRVEGTDIFMRGKMREDDDLPAEESPGMWFDIAFKFPNVTLLSFPPEIGLKLLVITTPVEDMASWVCARYYQSKINLPFVGKLAAEAALYFEWEIVQAKQDVPVLASLRPHHTDVGVNHLVNADRGSGQYLRIRRKLLDEAGIPRTLPVEHDTP